MLDFSPKLELICRYTDEEFSHFSQVVFADLKVESYFFGGNYPGSLLDGDFIIASQNQIKIHRERKEREQKG